MTRWVIRDAVIFEEDGRRVEGDVLVDGERIAKVGDVGNAGDAQEVRAEGRWLWPGVIDAHVHFREPGPTHKEDWDSGSAAAVSGGVTSVIDMPNTSPATTTLERLSEKREVARAKARCNVGLYFGANPHNLEAILTSQGEAAVAGLKIFMADSTGDLLVDRYEDLERIFEAYSGRICVHAEDPQRMREREAMFEGREDPGVHSEIRDAETAARAVAVAGELAARFGRRVHVLHLSTRAELLALKEAQARLEEVGGGGRITCEVCPHHLFLDARDYEFWGTRVQMNPPLRTEAERDAMWEALGRGEVAMIATDHAPHTPEEKAHPYGQAPSGVPGVELSLPLMLDAAFRGVCSYEEVLGWMCEGPARVHQVVDRGRIAEGAFADLVLIDPHMMRRVEDKDQRSRCGWTPYAGRDLTGWPVRTWVNGNEVFRRLDEGAGEVVGTGGEGMWMMFEG
ncbi:amidohydrolase family protein [Lujinxingia vulgaris]|uniref:Amidohydrolase family protein n=1 Tax=Lujinxingia vulgaris TaxID=2600176 RepID=A0A5C6X4Q7_9DELT|nr:dihydroorotase [Lujinxingia vulgaris]TXD34099.1 amidohydrolase family protein [Lujinxingia vulgaris]